MNPNVLPSAAVEIDAAGLTKSDLPTPALCVDLAAFEANLATVAAQCRTTGRAFRPHAKTHKCPAIARRQAAAGAIGISVATLGEAEAMVDAGLRGILLTSPIVDPKKAARLMALARRTDVMVAVGQERPADLLAEAASAAKLRLDVLVDVDVGDRRTGALPGDAALALAQHIAGRPSLRVCGVQAYAGHASHVVGFEAREKASREALAKAVETKHLLARAGFDARILSGGSTGTYNIDSAIDGVTELQVGSFVFMDVDYRRIGGRGQAVYTDFRPSLTVLTSVVSTTHVDRVTIDAGTKAIDTTTTHRPDPVDRPGLLYAKAGDEFGVLTADGVRLPELGERLEFLVPHCDPTVNLYDRLYACRGNRVEAIWPVFARRG